MNSLAAGGHTRLEGWEERGMEGGRGEARGGGGSHNIIVWISNTLCHIHVRLEGGEVGGGEEGK